MINPLTFNKLDVTANDLMLNWRQWRMGRTVSNIHNFLACDFSVL